MEEHFTFNERLKRFEPIEKKCRYCGKDDSCESTTNHFQKIYKENDRTNLLVYRSVKFNIVTIGIPRCALCRDIHESAKEKALLISFGASLLTIVLGFILFGIFGFFAIFAAIFVGVFGYFYLVKKLVERKGIETSVNGAKQDKTVEYLLNTGWTTNRPSA
ncbi:hypothetical protein [Ferruginibacter albus]|uniref:hypothetical protein n=1 Tax=Ferruginibacter albus TaxID=2875540 RepID=UPI001CC39637|nr:hypothetical protein [Ferruginibacter albus]UAY51490.1 hypothetical protein K9M53_12950 [Ferruginibacter albus]